MASLKLYLDKRSIKKDGTYPIKITVTHKKPFHISLDVSVPKQNWIGGKIEGDIRNKAFLNNYIKARYSAIENFILTLKLQGLLDSLTPAELKHKIEQINAPEEEPVQKKNQKQNGYLFAEHAKLFIESREAPGTRETYTYTLNMLGKHFDLSTLTFDLIDYNWLENLNIRLRPTCKVNTRSIHFRNIRAIFRNATKKKFISKDLYPFDDFTIGTEETLHRNLSIQQLRQIRDFEGEPHQEKYRDLFMLLFYLIGINTVDILHATAINNGRLEYKRAKTGKIYSVKVPPEAMKIIAKYSPGKKYLLNFLDNYDSYRNFRHRFNDNLKYLGPVQWINAKSKNGRPIKKKEHSPLIPNLSSYYARHTWATLAAQLDIPEKTIRMALGHGTRTVTDIYINFDISKVDEANRKVIDFFNADKL